MQDLISRQAAIDAVMDLPNTENGYSDAYDKARIISLIEDIPPVIPKRQTGEWIPCGERLPEAGVTVLVSSDHGHVYTSCFRHGEFEYGGNAIAWMPLPPSYQGDE